MKDIGVLSDFNGFWCFYCLNCNKSISEWYGLGSPDDTPEPKHECIKNLDVKEGE